MLVRSCTTRLCPRTRPRFNSHAATPTPDPPPAAPKPVERAAKPANWYNHPRLSAHPPKMTAEVREHLGKALVATVNNQNHRTIPFHPRAIFYHTPSSPASCSSLLAIQALHMNKTQHLVPLRFFLQVKDTLPDAETFRDLMYKAGSASYNIFLWRSAAVHVSGAPALVELLAKEPKELRAPIIHLVQHTGEQVFIGPKAVSELEDVLKKYRIKYIGETNEGLLNRFAMKGELYPGPKKTKIKK
ncbi:hypothetical protein DFH06DRAFT_639159 [Mycena polygramma]|nr:hypothetical protein DFH06DRAFT_639159 [Mycena polygramma]